MAPANVAALNAVCPYFTMFPLEFPLQILQRRANGGDRVLDPFCGRGTTNFAARLVGLESLGVDSSPVAAAITAAKLVATTATEITAEAQAILSNGRNKSRPRSEFWQWAFHPEVLDSICKLRGALLEDRSSPSRIALRAIMLGSLHGPRQKTFPSYFSNQSPRTYAPKPGYAVRYWKEHSLVPERVDVAKVIQRRAQRYYAQALRPRGEARLGDSRALRMLSPGSQVQPFRWVITSPPYYGMKTYLQDQWLRYWFLGGPDQVDYRCADQLVHASPADFAADLRKVWRNTAEVCSSDAKMIVRFGGISDRSVDPLDVLKDSLRDSGWRICTAREAGSAEKGKRQADHFLRTRSKALVEYDVWTVRER